MKKEILAVALSCALAQSYCASAADGVRIDHLGVNNTLVRVDGAEGRYLILPVQESNDDARINVLVDGKIAETIYVRLAKSKTDYTVPFDLGPYAGHKVILDVVTPQGRSSVREAKDDVCWKSIGISSEFDTANREKYRPAYHHAPLYGWMNDPNGMFYKDGRWHLYYQYNPYGSKWQNMTWGHSSSTDLVNWEHHGEPLRPDGLGSVFSGSCAIDSTNSAGFGKDAVIAMFTSAGTSQMQSLAASTDGGKTFERYAGNPVITLESEARDPNMFFNKATGEWNLVLAHALDHEILFFTSPDMHNWTLQSAFGKGEGGQDGVWECPDLFELPVDGTNEKKWMLLVNINPGGPFGGSAAQYFIGTWDGHTFKADTDASGKISTKWLDFGKDNYAIVSWSDAPQGRRTAIGWMSNWQYAAEVPTLQFRSANTLPREIGLFRAADGQVYASSMPSPELLALRGKLEFGKRRVSLGASGQSFALPAANDGICEILLDIKSAGKAKVNVTLSNKAGEKTVIVYNPVDHTVAFDRRESGVTDFSEEFPAVTVSPTFEESGKVSLRLYVDRSSIELFGDNGRFVMTNLVFPTRPYSAITLSAEGGKATAENLKVYSIITK